MKKLFSYALCLVLLLMMGAPAWAEVPVLNKNAVSELYSAEGIAGWYYSLVTPFAYG